MSESVSLLEDLRPYENAIWELLSIADEEFVPPLSARTGTRQRTGLDDGTGDDLETYFEACLDHEFIITKKAGSLIGFLSFHAGYEIEELRDHVPSNYVSTVIVHPEHRHKGYARGLYEFLLEDLPADLQQPFVTTRTWGTNHGHLSLLEDLGFTCLTRVPNDRGDGIDTVYYGLDLAEDGAQTD